jgi:hypothetical protein
MDVYAVIWQTNSILDSGKYAFDGTWAYWPGVYVFTTVLSLSTNISVEWIAKLFPLFIILSISLCLFYAMRDYISTKIALLSILVIFSICFFQEIHFSKQGFSLILLSFMLPLLTHLFKKQRSKKNIFLFLMLFIAIVFSHPLVPVVLIFSLFFIEIAQRLSIFPTPAYSFKKINKQKLYLLIILTSIWTLYLLSISNWIFDDAIRIILSIFNESFLLPYIQPLSSIDKQFINQIRLIDVLIGLLIGAALSLILFNKKYAKNTVLLYVSFIIFAFPGLLLSTNAAGYFNRTLLYSLLPLTLLVAWFFVYLRRSKKANSKFNMSKIYQCLLVIIMAFGVMTFPLSQYGDFSTTYIPDSSFSSYHYLLNNGRSFISTDGPNFYVGNVPGSSIYYLNREYGTALLQRDLSNGDLYVFFNFEYNFLTLYYSQGSVYTSFYDQLSLVDHYHQIYSTTSSTILSR